MNKAVLKVFVFGCLFGVLFSAINSKMAVAADQSSSDLQGKLNTIQNQKSENQRKAEASKQKLSENQKKQDTLINNIKASDQKISTMNGRIDRAAKEVRRQQKDMALLKQKINKTEKRIETRKQLLKGRLRSVYINGGAVNYIDVLMGSTSFGDFVDRMIAVKMITDQDRKIINDQKQDKQTQIKNQEKLQSMLTQITNDLHSLETAKTGLNGEKAHKKRLLDELKEQASDIEKTAISAKEQASILGDQEAVIKQQLAQQQARAAAEKSKALRQKEIRQSANQKNGVNKGADTAAKTSETDQTADKRRGNFIMPAAGYISSGFGYRSFDGEMHPGIDIANSTGTPIHAAADGVVFRAYKSSSYGNCVMISHVINGQLYTTVYAHLSAIHVSTGQQVSQGQTIGAMGNTGESYGSHLHFELYVGRWTPPPHKGAVNPLNYMS